MISRVLGDFLYGMPSKIFVERVLQPWMNNPPSKTKWDVESTSEIDQESYEEAVENLKAELKKKSKGKYKTIKNLMDTTRAIHCR